MKNCFNCDYIWEIVRRAACRIVLSSKVFLCYENIFGLRRISVFYLRQRCAGTAWEIINRSRTKEWKRRREKNKYNFNIFRLPVVNIRNVFTVIVVK